MGIAQLHSAHPLENLSLFKDNYTNLIVTIVVAQAVGLFSSTPGLILFDIFGVGLCWVVLVCITFTINKE